MTELFDTYCPECDAEVHANLRAQQAVLAVRGEAINYSENVAICPVCGTAIGDARIESANLDRAYSAYRTKHGIMTPGEIKSLRASYGLSLREFSKFLGFGEQTTYRYERGDIPDQTHSNTLQSAQSVTGAQLLLSQNKSKLSDKSIFKIEQRIQVMEAGTAEDACLHIVQEEREANPPSVANGYRRLDYDRVAALVFTLANKCQELYWTKLQKATFFADMVYFERNSLSLTGLSYAHATYGPVMHHKDVVRYILVERGVVSFKEHGWGEVLIPQKCDDLPFTPDELAFIDEIAEFVNSFNTATDLSSFSHKLSCWDESVDGEIIDYDRNRGEIGEAMSARMKGLRKAARSN